MSHPLLSEPVGCDETGERVFVGHFTKKPVRESEAVKVSPLIPELRGHFYDVADYHESRRLAYREFCDVSERNCNTCKHLIRVPHERQSDGFLYGACGSTPVRNEPYPLMRLLDGEEVMKFHPNDPMHMECYESRWGED